MTDFLKRVAQTALGIAPVIQPLAASRYAPGPHLAMHEMLQTQEGSLESAVEQAAASEGEGLSPHPVSSTIGAIGHHASPPTAPGTTQRETGEHDLPQARAVEAAKSKSSRPAAVSETMPVFFGVSISQREAVLKAKAPAGPKTNGVTRRPEQTHETASAGDMQLEQLAPDAGYLEGQVRPDVDRRVAEILDMRDDPPHPRDAVDSPKVTGQREGGIVVDESKRRVRPEAFDREPSAASVLQSSYSEPEIPERNNHSRPAILKSESILVEHSASRRADPELRSSRNNGSENTYSPPVVRVTIGRIEVRAVMPPSPPVEVSASSTPKLSLDDYLRQHNGRER